MTTRDPAVEALLSSARDALLMRDLGLEAAAAIARIDAAIATPAAAGSRPARRQPVCEWLPHAYATARRQDAGLARLVDSFAALEPGLAWAPRASGGPNASPNWPESHANAMILGPGGLEQRTDVQIGASLLAPQVRYPDHDHDPEEVYLVLSPGRFRHGASGWFEPGVGGTLYNEPGIRHAMASDAAPLFALWFLWAGETGA